MRDDLPSCQLRNFSEVYGGIREMSQLLSISCNVFTRLLVPFGTGKSLSNDL